MYFSLPPVSAVVDKAVEEPAGSDDSSNLMDSCDDDVTVTKLRTRRAKSASLLKREQDAQGKVASRKFLAKVRSHVSPVRGEHFEKPWNLLCLHIMPVQNFSVVVWEMVSCNLW